MNYLRVHKWEKWQTYRRDRGHPPWIKVHRCLMREQKFIRLSDANRWHLISIWLLAADNDGRVPNDAAFIREIMHLNSDPDLNLFMQLGFLDVVVTSRRRQRGVTLASRRRQRDAPETETETEVEAEQRLAERAKRKLKLVQGRESDD